MIKQVNIEDGRLYKPCQKKSIEIWACMPPKGTFVINKLEQYEKLQELKPYIKCLGQRCFLTAKEMEIIRGKNQAVYNKIVNPKNSYGYLVDEKHNVVLSGTEGEMWTMNFDKFCEKYSLVYNNKAVEITTKIKGDSVVGWFKIRSKPLGEKNMALFVPKTQSGIINTGWAKLKYNGPGVKHGKGDFLICGITPQGLPDVGNKWVVNGRIFARTYRNNGWQDCLEKVDSVNVLKPTKELF